MFFHDSYPENPRYDGLVTIGVVSERKNDEVRGPLVRVTWPETGKTSALFPVAQFGTLGMRIFRCPRLGERVAVTRLANGPEQGIVLGGIYNGSVKSPTQGNLDNLHIEFDDGTTITFDPSSSTLTLDSKGPVNIKTKGSVELQSEGDVEVETQANLSAKASGTATVEAPNVELKGNVKISGDLTVEGALTSDGAQFNKDISVKGNGTASGLWIDSTGAGVGS
jgi:phage baseplate assembly protein V